MKKILKFAAVLIIIGSVFMLAGYATGAKRSIYLDNNGIHVGEASESVYKFNELPEFSGINVDIYSDDIEFVTSESQYAIQIKEEYTFLVEDGILKVTQPRDKLFIFDINLDFWDFNYKNNTIKIYIPQNSVFQSIEIKNRSGDIFLSDFSAESLNISNTSGNLDLNNLEINKMEIKVTSGDFNIQNLKTEDCYIKMVSGNLKADMFFSEKLYVNCISGNIILDGNLKGDSVVTATSGNIKLNLYEKPEAYKKTIDMISGNLYINGKKIKGYEDFEIKDNTNNLRVKTISGDVHLNFKE